MLCITEDLGSTTKGSRNFFHGATDIVNLRSHSMEEYGDSSPIEGGWSSLKQARVALVEPLPKSNGHVCRIFDFLCGFSRTIGP